MKPVLLLAFCLVSSFIELPIGSEQLYKGIYPGSAWEKADAGKLGWSAEKLNEALAYAQTLGPGGLMVIDGGKAVVDWGATDRRSKIASVRKSLLNALYGIHVHAGHIDLSTTLDQLGIDDNPPALTKAEKQATIRMLLQARSGIYHIPACGPGKLMPLPERGSHVPGTYWYYNNWDFNTLFGIFGQLTHTKISTEFEKQIAIPLQMQDYRPEDVYYTSGEESIYPYNSFRMTVRDLARFGYLYLRQGNWQGKQILSADWVKESIIPYSDTRELGPLMLGDYGYMWWVAKNGRLLPKVTVKDGSYCAIGSGGKFVIVLPAEDLVVTYCSLFNAPDYPSQKVDNGEAKPVSFDQMGKLLHLILAAKEQ